MRCCGSGDRTVDLELRQATLLVDMAGGAVRFSICGIDGNKVAGEFALEGGARVLRFRGKGPKVARRRAIDGARRSADLERSMRSTECRAAGRGRRGVRQKSKRQGEKDKGDIHCGGGRVAGGEVMRERESRETRRRPFIE